VLAAAGRDPSRLVLGMDPVAAAMAEASRRAARTAKGGMPNAVFVVGAVEALAPELDRIADTVTVTLPWASLLRGALAVDATVAGAIAHLVAPGGRVELLLAPSSRDARETDVQAALDHGLASRWQAIGMELVELRPATAGEVDRTASTWARRLRLGRPDAERESVRIVLRRPRDPGADAARGGSINGRGGA
jgi:hypothetical protein